MNKKVLIVEDDEANVKYLTTLMVESGYSVVSASDGAEGIRKAKDEKPDLVVLDVMMPKKSGFVVFSSMKKDSELAGIPVIMLTSIKNVITKGREGTDDETFEEMKEFYLDKMDKLVDKHEKSGVQRPEIFMDKPIEPDQFVNAVVSLIGRV
jgi:CheY-like chemotaxis protein